MKAIRSKDASCGIDLLNKPTITPDELFRSGVYPLGRNGIFNAIHRGEIAGFKIGKRFIIPTAPLKKLLGLA